MRGCLELQETRFILFPCHLCFPIFNIEKGLVDNSIWISKLMYDLVLLAGQFLVKGVKTQSVACS